MKQPSTIFFTTTDEQKENFIHSLKNNTPSISKYLAIISLFLLFAPTSYCAKKQDINTWVDSVFNSLTDDERIAQLMMIAAYSNKDAKHENEILETVKKYNVGGIMYLQGSPMRQFDLTNLYQKNAKTPMFIAIDGEWGLSMRLDSTIQYPRQMMLGAIQNDSLIYMMGRDIARQHKAMGIHINFAPVIDVNNNPLNPVINSRSFGEDKYAVTRKSLAYMRGMQDEGLIATAKHFPGHGDTKVDSHKDLPIILHPFERLDTLELYPFKELIKAGIKGIMVAHLSIPSLDSTPNRASTLSPLIVDSLLKKTLGFQNLVFTDALNMKGASNFFKPGDLEVLALLAGNDVLLMPDNVSVALTAINKAIQDTIISIDTIYSRCKKILHYKYLSGLEKGSITNNRGELMSTINDERFNGLNNQLIKSAITLVKNDSNIIPLKRLDTLKIASVSIGTGNATTFQRTLSLYTQVDTFSISKNGKADDFANLMLSLSTYNLVIVSLQNTTNSPYNNFGITKLSIDFINNLSIDKNVIVDIFANPYSLAYFNDAQSIKGLIVSYEDRDIVQQKSAQLIFGGISALGTLPVTASSYFPATTGIQTSKTRFSYVLPEEIGLSSMKLKTIDSIAAQIINIKASPGCQIIAAKDGEVFLHKAYGYHTYKKDETVQLTDLYDIASITKIMASVPSMMRLIDQNKIILKNDLQTYLPSLKSTNKGDIKLKDLLTHQAKLQPWIPFYKSTIEPLDTSEALFSNRFSEIYAIKLDKNTFMNINYRWKEGVFNLEKTDSFTIEVATGIFMNKRYIDTIYKMIDESELLKKEEYKYSDLGYYYLQKIIEGITTQPLNDYVKSTFYNQLGANYLGYLPLNTFPKQQIIPTENDHVFRNILLQGHVHDPGAAMLGGVAGHAGLFSNANDIAKMMQMYLNYGEYGAEQYFTTQTVAEFVACQNCNSKNRRGIGFDKPELDKKKVNPTSDKASPSSFGHSGFTGTFAWADPQNGLVYVFLSNRVHPNQFNNKLSEENFRTVILDKLYEIVDEK